MVIRCSRRTLCPSANWYPVPVMTSPSFSDDLCQPLASMRLVLGPPTAPLFNRAVVASHVEADHHVRISPAVIGNRTFEGDFAREIDGPRVMGEERRRC